MKLNNQISSELQWVSQMDVDIETNHSRKTSIIGTIGNIPILNRHTIINNSSSNSF
jgi:hypothetical protein